MRLTRPTARRLTATLVLALGLGSAFAQAPSIVEVQAPWVRATVKGQQATGMFATLTAPQGGTLVGARSPVAGTVEVHEMKMDGDVMRMRAVPRLALPAGAAVALKPGSYHVMLMGLKQSLPVGSTVPVTLVVEDAQRKQQLVELQVPVRQQAPAAKADAAGAAGHDHGQGHGHQDGHQRGHAEHKH